MYNVGASILQSVGDSRSPMKYLITASLINIVLDLLFIGVLGYGVAAAAFATIISQSVSAHSGILQADAQQGSLGCELAQGSV